MKSRYSAFVPAPAKPCSCRHRRQMTPRRLQPSSPLLCFTRPQAAMISRDCYHGSNFGEIYLLCIPDHSTAELLTLSQWKTFDFFEVSQVNPPDDESRSFFDNNEISCVCSGSESLFLGSHDGVVRILSSSFKILRTFQAHDTGSITHMKQVEGTSLLVTISVCIYGMGGNTSLIFYRKIFPMSLF